MPKPGEGWSPPTKMDQETCFLEKADFMLHVQRPADRVWEIGSDKVNCRCIEFFHK